MPKQGYENKVFYVWFDAPIGYISITANYAPDAWQRWWKDPKNVELVQFMGKDNIPFHTVMFPSTLMAADSNYTLLHHVSCTEYLQYEGTKFSKSRGTGVFGDGAMESGIPSEVWRYYLLFNRPETSDTVFLWEDFQNKNNTELLNNLGNFINRTLSFLYSKCGNIVPNANLLPEDRVFLQELSELKAEYIDHLEHVRIKDGLKSVMAISKKANQFMQDNKPVSQTHGLLHDVQQRAHCCSRVNRCLMLLYPFCSVGAVQDRSGSMRHHPLSQRQLDQHAGSASGALHAHVDHQDQRAAEPACAGGGCARCRRCIQSHIQAHCGQRAHPRGSFRAIPKGGR